MEYFLDLCSNTNKYCVYDYNLRQYDVIGEKNKSKDIQDVWNNMIYMKIQIMYY